MTRQTGFVRLGTLIPRSPSAGGATTSASVTSRPGGVEVPRRRLRVPAARETGVPARPILQRERRLAPAVPARALLERWEIAPLLDDALGHGAKALERGWVRGPIHLHLRSPRRPLERLDANGEGFRGNPIGGSPSWRTSALLLGASLWAPMRPVGGRPAGRGSEVRATYPTPGCPNAQWDDRARQRSRRGTTAPPCTRVAQRARCNVR